MRASIRTWVIAAAIVVAPSAAHAAGSNNSHSQIVNMNLGNLISPSILSNPATASVVRNDAGAAGRTGTGNLGPSVEPIVGRDVLQHQSQGKRDVADKLDISDKTSSKTVEAAEKTDAKKSDTVTRIAANVADEAAPSQQPAARANTPPPPCR